MNNITQLLIKVPLGGQAHAKALKFAAQQNTPQKGKRVYLNTLAVYAVHSYLKWLQIETNLSQSDSWHPFKQAVFDVADLVIPGIGKLECCPVLPGETAFHLPSEVTENCIGYVGVQFGDRLDEVQLLGFVPVDTIYQREQLEIADFQPLDALIDRIYQLKSTEQSDEVNYLTVRETSDLQSQTKVSLSQWFQNTFEVGWQSVEALLGTQKANLALRSANPFTQLDNLQACVRRGQLIDLGMQLASHSIALVVAIAPAVEQEVDILLQVHPMEALTYLPPLLQLIVLDEAGTTVLEAQARSADNYIQLQFSGEMGEGFSVKVALGDVSVTQDFAI